MSANNLKQHFHFMTFPLPLKTQWYHWLELKGTQLCRWMTSCLSLPTSLQRPTPVNTPQHQESMSIPHPWDSTGSGPDRLLSSRLELCNSLEVCLHGPSNHCSVLWTLQPNWFSFYPPHPALAARTSDAVKGSVLLYIQDTSASPLTLCYSFLQPHCECGPVTV